MRLNKLLGLFILCIGLTLTSCSIEDGKDGIDGIDGLDGKDGANGQDGTPGEDGAPGEAGAAGQDGVDGVDGEDGIGLNELAEYGAITLELSGQRPDGVAFVDSNSFKFFPIDATDFVNYNIMSYTQSGDDITYTIKFRRFISSPDATYNITYIDISMVVLNPGQASQDIQSLTYVLNNYGVIGPDYKYFIIDDTYHAGGTGVSEIVIPDLNFEISGGNHLTFSYSFTVAGANNSSTNDLNVSGTVDVNLFELIVP